MRIAEIMRTPVERALAGDALDEVRDRMEADDIRHVPVVDGDDRVIGMLSDRDLLRARASRPSPRLVSDIMVKHVRTVAPDAPAGDAAQLMLDFKIDAVPVVAGGKLVGIVTTTDFLAAFCRLQQAK
ncbi:MAG: CBS domain-containing protein [Myxococcales bacterium]